MKTLLLIISIFAADSVDGEMKRPEDMSWLKGQWNTSSAFESIVEELDLPGSRMIFVDQEGNVLTAVKVNTFENKELSEVQTRIYLRSDFLFEATNGDQYYLSE